MDNNNDSLTHETRFQPVYGLFLGIFYRAAFLVRAILTRSGSMTALVSHHLLDEEKTVSNEILAGVLWQVQENMDRARELVRSWHQKDRGA